MTTSVKLNPELKSRVQQLAETRSRSAHWIMCEAIRDYVEREEKRENYKKEATIAWQAYQQSGRHVTLEEADLWLAKLEAGQDTELPK
jgi:predicted transcriptional regulator